MTNTNTSSPEETSGGQTPQYGEERDPAVLSGTHAPGGDSLDGEVADQDIDKVVPRDPKETASHDHSAGDSDARDALDDSGRVPRAL